MLDCFDVAKYFLTKVDEEEGEVITHLKLQKLAYYAQSASLAFYDVPLFPQDVMAWKHGPVVPELYQEYKNFGSSPLPRTEVSAADVLNPCERKLLDDVYVFFGQFAAWKLRDMTHEETPWKEAFPTQGVISRDSMRDYFRVHWGDDMRAAVGTPEAMLQKLLDAHWTPTQDTLEAARRYKMERTASEGYRSAAV